MIRLASLISALLFTGLFCQAQQVPPRVCIDSLFARSSPCEPSIAIDPNNPALMVAGSVLNRVYHSTDSGKTWVGRSLESEYGVWGDPVLIPGDSGVFYYFHLSDPTGKNWRSDEILDRIVCERSGDGGATFLTAGYAGLNTPKDQDKHWAIYDPVRQTIHLTWTEFDDYGSEDTSAHSRILYSCSADDGATWTPALKISEREGNCIDGDETTEGAVPAIGPNQEVYVSWAYDSKIWFDRSLDSGATWLPVDRIIGQQPGGWDIDIPGINRANGMPVTVCDLSQGPYRGRIYVSWVDERRGNYDVWLISSDDRGESWSEPRIIGEQNTESDQFFVWIDVDDITGYLYAVYYDRHGLMGNATHVTLAISMDGGGHFNTQHLTEDPFTPTRGTFFGDYNNIAAHNGIIRPIWTEMHDGKNSIWTSLIQKKTE